MKTKLVCIHPDSPESNDLKFNYSSKSKRLGKEEKICLSTSVWMFYEHFKENIVNRLVIIQIGTEIIPDLKEYSAIKTIEFCGNLQYIHTAFKLIHALKHQVNEVKFLLGYNGQMAYLKYDKISERIRPLRNITRLSIRMNTDIYYSTKDTKDLQQVVNSQVEKVIKYSQMYFPNINTFECEMTDQNFEQVKQFVDSYPELGRKYEVAFKKCLVVVKEKSKESQRPTDPRLRSLHSSTSTSSISSTEFTWSCPNAKPRTQSMTDLKEHYEDISSHEEVFEDMSSEDDFDKRSLTTISPVKRSHSLQRENSQLVEISPDSGFSSKSSFDHHDSSHLERKFKDEVVVVAVTDPRRDPRLSSSFVFRRNGSAVDLMPASPTPLVID